VSALLERERAAFDAMRRECEDMRSQLSQLVVAAKTHVAELAVSKETAQSHLVSMAQAQQVLAVQMQTFAQINTQLQVGHGDACHCAHGHGCAYELDPAVLCSRVLR
jgi:hypothetical protein